MEDSIFRIPTLPSELITEILSRLPVKSLLKFRSVSKYWLDLISSPEFIKSHLDLSTTNKDNTHHRLLSSYPHKYNFKDWSLRSLLYESDVTEASNLNYPMKNPQKSFRSMDSVNGLICLIDLSENLFLWNPSIRKYKKLLDFRTYSRDVISHFIYGFGYDKFHDDYKVVACTYYHDGHSRDVEVEIYSLKSNSWRSIDSLEKGVRIIRSGKFVNEKIYWVNDNSSDRNIIYIDLADEKWEKVEQPSYGEGDYDLQLGLYGNDLSGYINNRRKCVSIWVMKKSWTKIFTINYAGSTFSYALPFFMSNKGEIIVGFRSTNFMIYNPKDESLRSAIIDSDEYWYSEIYVESLVSPFSIFYRKD